MHFRTLALACVCLARASSARAQPPSPPSSASLAAAREASGGGWPSEPVALAGGRVTIGADVSASVGANDAGFFNYTDYDHSTLRTLRIDVMGAVNAGSHIAVLAK